MSVISIRGARTHNLKNINLDLPANKLIVFTGLSGSGKSSLAFDTIFAEGQRRYVESLSAYARQFLSMMEKPDVDSIEGLSPAISIEQKATSHNPRSTVGTITEIYDYIRLLFARVGEPKCPTHQTTLHAMTVSQMVDAVSLLPLESKIMILSPVVRERKGEHVDIINELQSKGYVRARIDGQIVDLADAPKLTLRQKHTIEVIVDRLRVRSDSSGRLAESIENALTLSEGLVIIAPMDDEAFPESLYSSTFACTECGYSLSELEPRMFSFNNPVGACPSCDGLGVLQYFDPDKVVHQHTLSLAEGVISGVDRRNYYAYSILQSLAEYYGFSVDSAWCDLSADIQNMLLNGSDGESITFHYADGRIKKHPFEGFLKNMERRYRETESMLVREELSKYISDKSCTECLGQRLRIEARHVFIEDTNIPDLVNRSIEDAHGFFSTLKLSGNRAEIAARINKEISARLQFLMNVGLEYLTLARTAETLSGGEAQRIRLASQIGSGLVGVMYVLDEPSIGLHQRDNERLLQTLTRLRDLGNTVIVVEHDEDAIQMADFVVDIGPGAGVHGGNIVVAGLPEDVKNHPDSLTGQYLSGKRGIEIPKNRVTYDPAKVITLNNVICNNLNGVTVSIPLGLMTCITGVSGSGKSSLINDTLYPVAANRLNRANLTVKGKFASLVGLDQCDKVIDINQSPIGRTPRSNPATYTGLFTTIRELFAGTQESRARGYSVGRFSFNVKGGRCEACQGDGVIKVAMHFLPDIYVPCDICHGKRYNRETLEVLYKGKTVHDVLEMTVEDARVFFDAIPSLARKCQTLIEVGLSYIRLGQAATTLSGGEAQRIKLAKELSKRGTGKTLYILDEPTTGLHFHDIHQLLTVVHKLRDQGNTIVIIEHNLDVIKTADWIIDLGPEGGNKGGQILVEGTPEDVAKTKHSYTGHFLSRIL